MDEITEKTVVPKELGDMIEKEVEILLNKGLGGLKAVQLGIKAALAKWEGIDYGRNSGRNVYFERVRR